MYAIIKNEKIINPSSWELTAEYKQIDFDYDTFVSKPENYYIYKNNKVTINPNFYEEQKLKRQTDFEKQFLLTSKGYYRLQPEGFANAQQSIDTINNTVDKLGFLPKKYADEVIFYATPDFSKAEECTEEWLVKHQIHLEPMSKEEWDEFYLEFVWLYGKKNYKK